ncbi:C39 family peptidase [uncultured Clostridium sp.]|uniref:C39 family peptidase n=1 Tax=uncultured Clostridium sp. TaxID=59620 RepID=UPI0032177354
MRIKEYQDKTYVLKGISIVIRIMILFTLCLLTVYTSASSKSYETRSISLVSDSKYSNDELKNEKITEMTSSNVMELNGKECSEQYKLISVPYISQAGGYPTGCEIVSASMLLQHYEYDVSVDEFIDNYLERSSLEEINGNLYGPNPNEAFVGDPRSVVYSYGCYAPVIVSSLNKILGEEHWVKNTTGSEFNELIENYIDKEIPVLVWTSINLIPTSVGTEWYVRESGERIQWISNEHCMVLVGYDKDKYYFNDPYEDNGVVGYDKELVEKRFKELGNQSVVILNK